MCSMAPARGLCNCGCESGRAIFWKYHGLYSTAYSASDQGSGVLGILHAVKYQHKAALLLAADTCDNIV